MNFFTIITLNSFSDRLPGRTGWWEGREAREEAELGIIMADSLLFYDRNQHNIVKIKLEKKKRVALLDAVDIKVKIHHP